MSIAMRQITDGKSKNMNEKKVSIDFVATGIFAPYYAAIELCCDTAELTAWDYHDLDIIKRMAVRNRRVLRWDVCNRLTGSAVAELLDEIAPLAQRVVDGYFVEWDGNKKAGRYTDAAAEAADEIDALCSDAAERLRLDTVSIMRQT
jgi:hypothetical protein